MDAKQIYLTARAAGFSYYAAQTATAIALAESGGDPSDIGDTKLTTATWGPSVGLMQIRSLNSQKGTGKIRDATRLTDPLFNMKAAYTISAGGTNWVPWTTYPAKSNAFKAQAIGAALSSQPLLSKPLPTEKDWLTLLIQNGVPFGAQINAGGDALAGAINGTVGDPVAAAKSALAMAAKAGAWVSNSHNWARVALVVAGSAGVLAGLTMLAKAGAGPVSSIAGAPAKAAKAAATVVPAGRIAKAAGAVTKAAKKG